MAKNAKKFPVPRSDSFLGGYLTAALWSSTDESDESGGNPLDDNYDISDISDKLMGKAIADCNKFEAENASDLAATGADDSQNGHDFWLTRNGHGVGFWDRGYDEKLGDRLTDACKKFGYFNIYIGDDGKLYGDRG
jgi:hypothetical protein